MSNAECVHKYGIVAGHVLAILGNVNSGVNRMKFVTFIRVAV